MKGDRPRFFAVWAVTQRGVARWGRGKRYAENMSSNTTSSSHISPAPDCTNRSVKSIGSRGSILSIGSGELVLQYWLCELGVFYWFGILAWVHRLCLFCRGRCLVPGLSWRAVGLFGALCALGRVVSVGAESKSSPGDSAVWSFTLLSARASWAGGVPGGGGGKMVPL